MSAKDDLDSVPAATKLKIDLNSAETLSEAKSDLPTEIAMDGSGDQNLSPEPALALSEDAATSKNAVDGAGDNTEAVKTSALKENSTSDKKLEDKEEQHEKEIESPSTGRISSINNEALEILPAFPEASQVSENSEMDSGNTEEDLVLRWEDDEEESVVSPSNDTGDKNLHGENDEPTTETTKLNDLDDNNTTLSGKNQNELPENTDTDVDTTVSKNQRVSLKLDTGADVNTAMLQDDKSKAEPKSSDYDTDDQEDLLSEIDAQIAELGESLRKAENEKQKIKEKCSKSKVPSPDKSSKKENLEKSGITITISDFDSKAEKYQVSDKEIDATDQSNIEKTNIDLDSKSSEMETEKMLLEEKTDNLTSATDKHDNFDNINQAKTDNTEMDSVNNVSNQTNIESDTKTKSDITETAMEVDTLAIDENDLSLDEDQNENLSKNTKLLANSTKLDSSANKIDTVDRDNFTHFSSTSIEEKRHGVNKPNVMLEIPSQELIDLDDSELLSEDNESSTDKHETEDVSASIDLTDDGDVDAVESMDYENESTVNIRSEQLNDEITIEENKIEDTEKSNAPKDGLKQGENQTLQENLSKEVVSFADTIKLSGETVVDLKKPNIDINKTTDDVDLQGKEVNIEDIQISKEADLEKQLLEAAKIDENRILEETRNSPAVETTSKEDTPTTDAEKISNKIEDPCTSKDSSELMDIQPSASQMALQTVADNSDDAADATDSLGLLAESSRVREDDDADVDDQETSDHDDYDDDLDPDDESNLQTAEHSGDSAQNSESDMPKQPVKYAEKAYGILDSIAQEMDENIDTVEKDIGEIDTNVDKADDGADAIDNEIDATDNEIDATDNEIDATDNEIDAMDNEIEATESEIGAAEKETGDMETADKEATEQLEEDKELKIKISNVVAEDKDTKTDLDIDDDIVCGEVEIGPANTSLEVDTTALVAENNEAPKKLEIPSKVYTESVLRELLSKEASEKSKKEAKTTEQTTSPSKKKLEISKPKYVENIVELEDDSSEDEAVQEKINVEAQEVTQVNISKEIEVMSVGDNTSEIITKDGEIVINVPKAAAVQKVTSRLNTGELTIKTASSSSEWTLVIPEAKMGENKEEASKPKFGALEIWSVDSDDEDAPAAQPQDSTPEPSAEQELDKSAIKCVNPACTSEASVPFYPASTSVSSYYEWRNKKRGMVCQTCLQLQLERAERLVEGIKNFTPLLELEAVRATQELVEISDSDSEDESAGRVDPADRIHPDKAEELERQLTDMLNEVWGKYNLNDRLKEAESELTADLENLEKESMEVNQLLDECQMATDKLRSELYATFEVERHNLPAVIIHDTPDRYFVAPEAAPPSEKEGKRRLSSANESQAKKQAIPGAEKEKSISTKLEELKKASALSAESSMDDDKDISVVTLSAESAPADLPPPGEVVRPMLLPGQMTFAMRHAFGSWIKARLLEVTPKGTAATAQNFTMCRVKFENKTSRNAYKLLSARCLAYFEPPSVRMTIGTRVIALFKDTSGDNSGKRESFYSGVVAEVPNPVNKYRYLVFFDDGYAQYVNHSDTRLVCESSSLVWEEVHPFSREFVREYLLAYPSRPMVRLHTGQSLKTEWNGKWWLSRVIAVDASLVQVYFEQDKRTEWIYRGSTRLAPLYLELQAAEKHRARPLPRNRAQTKLNMPYVEYTRLDEQHENIKSAAEAQIKAQQEEMRRQRAVAKKSTVPNNYLPPQAAGGNLDAVTSRVVYYTPKNAVKPYKFTPHTCGVKCKRTDVLALKDLRTYNPLAKPLLSGWERQIVRKAGGGGQKAVMYRAPCGRRVRSLPELHRYLRAVHSDMPVDLFDFQPATHCLAEFVLNKCIVGKKDLSHGKENVPVPCVNYYDESLPEFCSYNTERTPTAGVPLNLDPEFLCGCDCTDDCEDKSKCACWKMTLEGARTIGLDPNNVGYVYKRLPDPLPSGIYECNVRCKCKQTCLNRVAQHPLQLKLQVFKTLNRGWGIRALNDVPKGAFLCIYAGNLLTDATANLDGLNEGDEYLAELDYIEVVEQMKEGYEDDIPDGDRTLDKKEQKEKESESSETESEEEPTQTKSDDEDGNFDPGFIPDLITGFSKRLRKRDKKKQKDAENNEKDKDSNKDKENPDEDCITISDDEELREPSRFAAQAGMGGQFISKYRSVRTLFGEDEACYIMDAKVQGNIGRYLNHSCSPNVFVQNVFVDTHDPRFPWVAFFALTHIRAGTELTWNYNYDVGSVPGKALYCYCGAPNCRGRLL